MNRHWNLRDELYNLFHRWPILLAAILIGSVLGWGLSWIWPAHYRATSQIYVALNPYRKFSDTLFEALANPKYSNLDNYHYWQMSQLGSAIFLDSFLQPTLDRLRTMDPYWQNVDLEYLRGLLDSEWRSSGTWALIANHPQSEYASQATQVWSDVIVEQVTGAVAAARRQFMIDGQLQAGEVELLQTGLRLQELAFTQNSIEVWQHGIADRNQSDPLDQNQRWQLLALISQPADFNPAWLAALAGQPPVDAPLQDYLSWIDQVTLVIQTEKEALTRRMGVLDKRQIELAGSYSIEAKSSLGFSPNIEVDRKEDLGVRVVRPTSTLVLIGGCVGLLIGLLYQLVMISNPWKREQAQ